MKIGSRGSALALAQARWVAERLPGESEIVTITTTGDRAAALGDKSRWVGELEQALLSGRIDVAVHSAKDVPAELAEGLELVAVPPRADPRDALCGAASLDALPPGARVGTSSLRREAQLRARRPELDVVELRGNVDTRLRKLADGEVQAAVLACAGLARLGREAAVGAVLEELVPAAGQGTLAIEARAAWEGREQLRVIHDRSAALCLGAERELTRALGASCNTPVGAHARLRGESDVELRAWLGLPDGSAWLSDRLRGEAQGLGRRVAERLRSAGAEELLRQAEAQAAVTAAGSRGGAPA